jgi:predicted AlkP superfamily phosphohydrolase/phosphomutase
VGRRIGTVVATTVPALLAAIVAATMPSCRSPARPSGRVVVLGVDALHLPLLEQLVAEGAVPNFARLFQEGNAGGVLTAPAGLPPLSPRIWTSFATGELPDRHGIRAWLYRDGDGKNRLVSSHQRRASAVWEIASASGKSVGVVNWLVTYPAERVKGFMVSDRYLPLVTRKVARRARVPFEREVRSLVYPPELRTTLDKLGLRPQWRLANTAARAEAADRNVFAIAYAALAEHPVDLLMIYTKSLDVLSHLKWHTHERALGQGPGRDEIVDFMRRYDGLLGELMGHLRPEDHLVVLSDHGMERARKGLPGQHTSAKSAIGTLIVYGPRVQRGIRQWGSVLDVAPTVLELLGISAPANMPGKVMTQLFEPGYVAPPRRTEPYQRRPPEGSGREGTEADTAIMEQLRALGYIQ